MVQPLNKLYSDNGVCASNGIVHTEPDREFLILLANIANVEYKLVKNQIIGTLLPHQTAVTETQLTLADVLGVAQEHLTMEEREAAAETNEAEVNLTKSKEASPHSNGTKPKAR